LSEKGLSVKYYFQVESVGTQLTMIRQIFADICRVNQLKSMLSAFYFFSLFHSVSSLSARAPF